MTHYMKQLKGDSKSGDKVLTQVEFLASGDAPRDGARGHLAPQHRHMCPCQASPSHLLPLTDGSVRGPPIHLTGVGYLPHKVATYLHGLLKSYTNYSVDRRM